MKKLLLSTLLATMLMGCAFHTAQVDTTNLDALKDLSQQELNANKPKGSNIRIKAIQDTALSIGAQGGLAWRADQINQVVDGNRDQLSQIFNFNALMLDHNVLPPVLVQSAKSLNQSDAFSLRIADRTYKIIQQAKFVTTPPTWDEYLTTHFVKPDVPDSTLLPRDKTERDIWQHYVELGWSQGVQQANNIYQANLARLKRDYQGMILYRKLLAQHMVSLPTVVRYDMGVTNNGDELRVNDQALQITATPQFKGNSNAWTPVLIQTK